MLKALFLLVLLYLSFFLKGQSQINSIIGDSSWYYYSGSWPNGDEDENQRITVHLKYVLKRLKSKNNPASSNRQRILSILEEYIKQQKFPKNTQYTERRPCFIDDNGTICAVGYLIEKTSGRQIAEKINSTFQYEYLLNIADPTLKEWQRNSGFSLKELAMIQPEYTFHHPTFGGEVFLNEETGKYGVKDERTGKTRCKAKYDEIIWAITPHGLGLVRVDSLWGVVDSMGSMKLKPRFNSYYVRSHFNQRFFLKRDTTYSMVSAKGKILHRGVYDDMPYEFGNFIYIRNKNKEGILSNSGKVLIPIKYDQLEYTWPNWFIAEQNNKFGIIDTLEREIVPIEFDHIYSLKRNFVCQKNQKIYFFNGSGPPFDINVDGVFPYGNPYHDNEILATKNEQYGLLKSGQWLIAPSFDTIIRYLDYHIVHQNGKVGYFNEMGLEIIPPEYDKITMRGKNFIVEKQNQFGVLNQDGANIISVECDSVVLLAWNKSGGYACCFAALRNNVWTIYDNRGYPISSTKYDLIGSLPQNTFYLKKDGKYQMGIFYNGQLQLFDKSFSYLDQLGYSNLVTFRDSSEKMGLISTDGTYLTKYNIRFESIFSDIKDVYLSGAYLVELEGKYGIINSRGRYTFEPIYDRYEKSPFEHSRQTYIYLFKNNRKYKAQLNGMLTPEDL